MLSKNIPDDLVKMLDRLKTLEKMDSNRPITENDHMWLQSVYSVLEKHGLLEAFLETIIKDKVSKKYTSPYNLCR